MSNGWCGWPATGGGGPEILNLRPSDFTTCPDGMQGDNPPLETRYPVQSSWFAPSLMFPPESTGGAWAEATFLTPSDTDASVNPYFTIYWATPVLVAAWASFEITVTCLPDAWFIAGGGAGTAITDLGMGAQTMMITSEVQVAPILQPWAPDTTVNIRLYRAYNAEPDIAGVIHVFGVRVRYART